MANPATPILGEVLPHVVLLSFELFWCLSGAIDPDLANITLKKRIEWQNKNSSVVGLKDI